MPLPDRRATPRARPIRAVLLSACLAAAGCADALPPAPPGATGPVIEGSLGYPRVVRLPAPPGTSGEPLLAASGARLFRSDDGGASWSPAGRIDPPPGDAMRCCEALLVLPRPLGAWPAGTILFAASYWVAGVPAVALFASTDLGRNWRYRGAPVRRGAAGGHGLWEPALAIAADGALALFWSDETDPRHSQKLAQLRTYDGVRWQDERDTVAVDAAADRPGMPTIGRAGQGGYLMGYEVCGPTADCGVFVRASADGWNFGDPRDIGTRVRSAGGDTLHSAPAIAWAPAAAAPAGKYLLVAKRILHPDGTASPLAGRRLFANAGPDGAGPWAPLDAPVRLPHVAEDNACQNYSSALLPAPDGATVLELAGDFDAGGGCVLHAARGPLGPPTLHDVALP